MKGLTPILHERFGVQVALARHYGPKKRLQRLVDQIDSATRVRYNPLRIGGIFGDIYNPLQAAAHYLVSAYSCIARREPLTLAQQALSNARRCLESGWSDNREVLLAATEELRRYYPLEAMALVI
jgi:hypothetical protein